jgi:hypothetical protein
MAFRTLLAETACRARVTWAIFFTLRMRSLTSLADGIYFPFSVSIRRIAVVRDFSTTMCC